MRCVVEDDYSALVISGTAGDGELREAWLSIYSEYCQLIDNIQIVAMIRQVVEIARLDAKITRVQALVASLADLYHPDLLKSLNNCGYNIKYDSGNQAAFDRALKGALSKLNPQILRLKQLQAEQPKNESGHKASYEDFEMTLAQISELQKYEVSDSISTYKYCIYVKKLKRHIETIKKSTGHGRKR